MHSWYFGTMADMTATDCLDWMEHDGSWILLQVI